jgi:CheY-like chemotaxis protein
VLLVVDEESLREIIRECLEDSGYTVIDADSGEAAVTRCTSYEGAIDLLITDVVMPGIGGREVAERLQTLRPRLRALYMSGYTDDAVVLHGVLAEDMAFLQKPFSALALAMKVRQVLDAPR